MGSSSKKVASTLALCLGAALGLGEINDESTIYGSFCLVDTGYADDNAVNTLICAGPGSDGVVHFLRIMHWGPLGWPYHVSLGPIQHQPDDSVQTIDVTYRFDDGTEFRETWEFDDDSAVDRSAATFSRFLGHMEHAERLIYQIGKERSAVDLSHAADAVADFRSRIPPPDEDAAEDHEPRVLRETDDERTVHGSCQVDTRHDRLTGVVNNHLICGGFGSSTGDHHIHIEHSSEPGAKAVSVWLDAGIQDRNGAVDVTYRFDDGTVFRDTWEWWGGPGGHHHAIDRAEETFGRFLDHMEQAERLIYHVGRERSEIDLTDAADAVTDFRSRIAFTVGGAPGP